MNYSNRPGKEPDDQDIAALFDAQDVSVPEELDDIILAAANEIGTEQRNTDDSHLEIDSDTRSKSSSVIKPLNKTAHRWFAIAASLVIGISVVPLLLRSPETSLTTPPAVAPIKSTTNSAAATTVDLNGGAAGDSVLDDSVLPEESTEAESVRSPRQSAQTLVQPETERFADNTAALRSSAQTHIPTTELQSTAPVTVEMARSDIPGADSAAISDIAPTSLPKKATNSLSPAQTAIPFVDIDTRLNSETERYRRNPNDWVQEIQRLENTGKAKQASEEYTLFRIRYPNYLPEFSLKSLTDTNNTAQEQ